MSTQKEKEITSFQTEYLFVGPFKLWNTFQSQQDLTLPKIDTQNIYVLVDTDYYKDRFLVKRGNKKK